MSEDVWVIVCAPATADYRLPGSVFHHKCMQCGQHVALAQSGQRELARHPDSKFLCLPCFAQRAPEATDTHKLAPGAMEEFIESLTDPDAGRPTKQ